MMDGAAEQSRRAEGDFGHISVMEREVVRLVTAQAVEQGRPLRCVDLTLGLAGHARAVAEILPAGSQVIGFDRDPAALERAKARMSEPGIEGIQTLFIQASFAEAEECLRARGMVPVDFVLFDLGLNSTQLDAGQRGFSLMSSGPLDMRMDPEGGGVTAGDLLNTLDAERLADIFWLLGEERYSRRIARALVKGRPWQSTLEVAEAISRTVGGRKGAKIHPATRCFQALRMAVNDELGAIRAGLPAAGRILRAGGVMAVISFHSLEHRLVKTFFRAGARRCLCPEEQPVCTCRFEPIFRWEQRREQRPTAEETADNPRSRSAAMRWARRTDAPWREDAFAQWESSGILDDWQRLEAWCVRRSQ